MRKTRNSLGAVLLAAALAGCAGSGNKLARDEGADLGAYKRIGVPAFKDSRGKGQEIALGVERLLSRYDHPGADRKALEELVARYKPDKEGGLGAEAVTSMREQAGADAVIFGKMAPDWSGVVVIVVETEMGGQVITGLVKPAKGKKAFGDPGEVADEVVRALTSAR